MSAEPNAAEPTTKPGPQHRFASLLGLVARIMDFGQTLVASLQRQNAPAPARPLAWRHGTFNLALIIARITRGLLLAAGLQARLLRGRPPRAANRPSPTRPAPPTPRPIRPSQAEDDATLLRAMPTADEIARRIRHQSVGTVIVDICQDLGIDTTHPLWPEIRDAIIAYDGSLARLLRLSMARMTALFVPPPQAGPAPQAWAGTLPASTAPS
jgi:hypothetical protein